LESGEPREVHHFCTLIGYGVTAINPYLAFETIKDLSKRGLLDGLTYEEGKKNFIKASVKGMLKFLQKWVFRLSEAIKALKFLRQ